MSFSELFPQTDWSQVRQATSQDPEQIRTAISALCLQYRDAICEWFRRDARTRDEAEDLTHDFLMRWLVRDAPLGRFERGELRFRDFLGTCLRYFVQERHARATRLKRGGGVAHEVFEESLALNEQQTSAGGGVDLELARQLFREVVDDMKQTWTARVGEGSFERLQEMALGFVPSRDYQGLASELRVPMGTLKGWIFRIRQEFHEGYRRRVRALVDPKELPEELRYLLELLASQGVRDRVSGNPSDRIQA